MWSVWPRLGYVCPTGGLTFLACFRQECVASVRHYSQLCVWNCSAFKRQTKYYHLAGGLLKAKMTVCHLNSPQHLFILCYLENYQRTRRSRDWGSGQEVTLGKITWKCKFWNSIIRFLNNKEEISRVKIFCRLLDALEYLWGWHILRHFQNNLSIILFIIFRGKKGKIRNKKIRRSVKLSWYYLELNSSSTRILHQNIKWKFSPWSKHFSLDAIRYISNKY